MLLTAVALALLGVGCLWWVFHPRQQAALTTPSCQHATNITIQRMLVVVTEPHPIEQRPPTVRGQVIDVKA